MLHKNTTKQPTHKFRCFTSLLACFSERLSSSFASIRLDWQLSSIHISIVQIRKSSVLSFKLSISSATILVESTFHSDRSRSNNRPFQSSTSRNVIRLSNPPEVAILSDYPIESNCVLLSITKLLDFSSAFPDRPRLHSGNVCEHH